MTSFEKYSKDVKEMRVRMESDGKRYFYRPDPNQKSEYSTAFQVGIGDEEEKLIDVHVAKVWKKEDAELIVKKLNSEIIPF